MPIRTISKDYKMKKFLAYSYWKDSPGEFYDINGNLKIAIYHYCPSRAPRLLPSRLGAASLVAYSFFSSLTPSSTFSSFFYPLFSRGFLSPLNSRGFLPFPLASRLTASWVLTSRLALIEVAKSSPNLFLIISTVSWSTVT